MKRIVLIVLFCLGAGLAAQAQETNAPAAVTAVDPIAALEKKLLGKLNDIEERLDRMEHDRKLEEIARDVADIKRDVERMENRR